MSDRLAELRRQRALVQQHLEWLEREIRLEDAKSNMDAARIAAATARAPQSPSSSRGTSATSAAPVTPAITPSSTSSSRDRASAASGTTAATAENEPDAEHLLEKYRVPATTLHNDVRKGCLLYFAAAFALFCALIVFLYFALSHR